MSLFDRKEEPQPLKANDILEAMKEMISKDHPEWKVITIKDVQCDLVLIRNILVNEKVEISSNPYHPYTHMKQSNYKVLIGINVGKEMKEEGFEMIEEGEECFRVLSRIFFVSSDKSLSRILKTYEKNH